MKVTFVSNFFNHHQKPFSDMMYKLTDSSYRFVSTEQMPLVRKEMGYDKISVPEYVIDSSLDTESQSMAKSIIEKSDVVIAGSVTEDYLYKYIQMNNLLFRYSERQFKSFSDRLKFPLRYIKLHKSNPKGKKIYLLAASAYSYHDYKFLGLFKNRAYKWGYFPKTIEYDIEQLLRKKDKNKILWCGRFLDWKHPDDALQVAKRLKVAGYVFTMNIIGTGALEQKLKDMIEQYQLNDCVHMLGPMPPESVREYMESSQIFLFTSDRNEGWGAVLNESMNSGCAVVASDAIGSVPYLMQDYENGLIYKSGDVNMLFEKVKWLLDNQSFAKVFGKKAYETITTEWNAEVAAERFLNLASHILAGEKHPDLYKTGPCSKAEITKDGWYKSK